MRQGFLLSGRTFSRECLQQTTVALFSWQERLKPRLPFPFRGGLGTMWQRCLSKSSGHNNWLPVAVFRSQILSTLKLLWTAPLVCKHNFLLLHSSSVLLQMVEPSILGSLDLWLFRQMSVVQITCKNDLLIYGHLDISQRDRLPNYTSTSIQLIMETLACHFHKIWVTSFSTIKNTCTPE